MPAMGNSKIKLCLNRHRDEGIRITKAGLHHQCSNKGWEIHHGRELMSYAIWNVLEILTSRNPCHFFFFAIHTSYFSWRFCSGAFLTPFSSPSFFSLLLLLFLFLLRYSFLFAYYAIFLVFFFSFRWFFSILLFQFLVLARAMLRRKLHVFMALISIWKEDGDK